MDKRVYRERMRAKQRQLQRRRMMKKVTYVVGAILLLIFVIRGVIFPIINRVGGGSANPETPADVQADANGEENTEEVSSSSGGLTIASRQPLRGMADVEKVLQLTSGWHEDSTGKWYRNTDGTYYVSGFQQIDGNTYAFDDNGYVRTGWYIDGSKEYFFEDNGIYDPEIRRPMLALTYDDGPGEYTMELLECLEKYNAKATFFMLGEHVELYPEEIKKMIEIGCELGNHSYDHPNLYDIGPEGAASQYERTDELLMQVCGQRSTVGRCPYGNGNSEYFQAVGKPFFMWSLDSLDWSYKDEDLDYDAVMNGDLTDGSIILMHDIHQPSVKASLRIIPALIEKGYRLVTVSELAEAKGVDLQYASYSDFWDSSLAAGIVPGYKGDGWNSIDQTTEDFESEEEDFEEDSDYSEESDYSEDSDYSEYYDSSDEDYEA